MDQYILSRDWMTIDMFWIDDRIYWTHLVTTLNRSISHTVKCSWLRCLVAASSVSGITSSQAGYHVTPSYSGCLLQLVLPPAASFRAGITLSRSGG
jgi:hypothetical protein